MGYRPTLVWQAMQCDLFFQSQMTKCLQNNPLYTLLSLFLFGACQDSGPLVGPDAIEPAGKLVDLSPGVFTASHQGQEVFTIRATKWRDGHRAAVSVTYDAPWGIHPVFSLATDAAIARGLAMDIEIVSNKLSHFKRVPNVQRMHEELIPNNIGFFGHGHAHIDHDALGYHAAYRSFRINYVMMRAWGLNPKTYAYPLFAGRDAQTQAANRQAGFIAARGGTRDANAYYICANSVREPENWYNLPSVIMGNASTRDPSTHDQLRPILLKTLRKRAWTIMTYHSIGHPEGWGYYPHAEFIRDLDFIKANDFWSGKFASIAAYIQERNALDIQIARYFGRDMPNRFEFILSDGLDNDLYDEPLTLDFTFNPDLNVRFAHIHPSQANGQNRFAVVEDRLRLNMVPDERLYALTIERESPNDPWADYASDGQ